MAKIRFGLETMFVVIFFAMVVFRVFLFKDGVFQWGEVFKWLFVFGAAWFGYWVVSEREKSK